MYELPLSPFGEVLTASKTPLVQLKFAANVNEALVTIANTGSGSVSHSNAMAVMSTGAATNSSANILSKDILRYNAGQGGEFLGTCIFTQGVAGSEQLVGWGDAADGLFFGFNGADFGILRRHNGTDTWISQADFNGDKSVSEDFDPEKGNVFRIKFQWLGFGGLEFEQEDSVSTRLKVVHTVPYSNLYTEPSLNNPMLPLCLMAKNTTNNTNIVVKSSSLSGSIYGVDARLGPRFFASGRQTALPSSNLNNIISIKNNSAFAGSTNRVAIEINKIILSADGTKQVDVQGYLNPTFGLGAPTFTDVEANQSVVGYFSGADTVTGGKLVYDTKLAKDGVQRDNADGFVLTAGNVLAIVGAPVSSTSDVKGILDWKELV